MQSPRPSVVQMILEAVLSFYNFEGVSFWTKWLRLALTATLVPIFLDLLPGELPASIAFVCWFSLFVGVIGLIVLLAARIFVEYEEYRKGQDKR